MVETYLQQHAGEARALLEQLCRQPSIAAQGVGIDAMATLVEGLLAESGFQTRRLHTPGAPPAIYGELRGAGTYTLLLYNHYDVQPADPVELWHSPAFEPEVRDGRLFARGAADNKGEIAARLAAIRALRAAGELPITIRWIIEGEEEIGSPHFEALAREYAGLLRADACLWEGVGFDASDSPELVLGAKGLLYVQLDVQGTGIDAHSGNAAILPSAAWRLVQALALLRDPSGHVRIPGFYDAVRPPSDSQYAALASQADMDAELAAAFQVERFADNLSGLELRLRRAFGPTCNLAGLASGYTGEGSKTVLPAKAMAKIDFRLVPDQHPEDILAKLKAYLDAQGYDDIQVTTFANSAPVVTPVEHPFAQRMIAIARDFAGKPPAVTPISYGTLPLLDSLVRYVGVPGLSAPGNPVYWANGMHAPNEHIRLADLERAVRFNCYLVEALGHA